MAAREAYLRVVSDPYAGHFEIVTGLELRDGDEWALLRLQLRDAMDHYEPDWLKCAEATERCIKANWPDRAYFIEVGADDDSWIQIFQPYGLPRD